MSYDNNVSTKKKIKKIVNGIISMAIVIIISGIVVLNMYATKVNKLKEADIKVETIKLENAIKDYKSRTGLFPALKGNENNLKALKSTDNLYNFAILYGENELYAIPENLVKNVVRTNKIVEKQDNTGGWVYDQMKGEIKPNIEIGKPSKPKKQKK
mgnify:CR=1 FL=1